MLAIINDTGIIVLIAAVVLLFGASQIPKVARNIAEAGKEFRKAHAEMEEAHPARPNIQELSPPASKEDRVTLTAAELKALLGDRNVPSDGLQA
jgi:TatA/E family protein of Tat protein translocase